MGFGDLLVRLLPTSLSDSTAAIFPPTTKFLPERDMPNLAGEVVIVTGGNTGIGFETCRQLVLHDAKVYLAARSAVKAEAAIARLKKETGKEDIHFLQLDLGDLKSVRSAAETFLSAEPRLDVLFNNAGVMIPPTDQLTAQGYDLQFGTNVVGHYFFTTLLISTLKAAHGRIVNTTSTGHQIAPAGTGLDFATIVGGPERDLIIKKWGSIKAPWILYGQSKLGNILLSNLWAREFKGEITSSAVHPGGIRTELARHASAILHGIFYILMEPVQKGAWTQLYAGTTANAEDVNGKYLVPWARIQKSSPQADVVATQEQLKTWLDEQVAKY